MRSLHGVRRRDNLRHSSNETKAQLDAVKKALAEAELEAAPLASNPDC
jgi:hypothetical protein